jgi:hypothetical protein
VTSNKFCCFAKIYALMAYPTSSATGYYKFMLNISEGRTCVQSPAGRKRLRHRVHQHTRPARAQFTKDNLVYNYLADLPQELNNKVRLLRSAESVSCHRAVVAPCLYLARASLATRSLDRNRQRVHETFYEEPVLLFSHGGLQAIEQLLVAHYNDAHTEGENHQLCSHVLPQPR